MTAPTPGVLAGEAVATQKVITSVPGVAGIVDNLGDLTDGIRAVRAWISNRHNWVRVAWTISGAAMFAVGIALLGERPVLQQAAAVAKAVPK